MGIIGEFTDTWYSEKAERAIRRDILAFLRTFNPKHTYYTIAKCVDAVSREYHVLHEWTFDTKRFGVGEYDSKRHVSLREIWHREGQLYADRHSGPCADLRTQSEHQAYCASFNGPDITGSLHDYADPDPRRAGGRSSARR